MCYIDLYSNLEAKSNNVTIFSMNILFLQENEIKNYDFVQNVPFPMCIFFSKCVFSIFKQNVAFPNY